MSLFPSATALLNCTEVVKGSLAARNTLFPPVTEISRAIQTINHALLILRQSSTKAQTDRRIHKKILGKKIKEYVYKVQMEVPRVSSGGNCEERLNICSVMCDLHLKQHAA